MKYFNIHKSLKIADFLTLANAICGLLAIIFAIYGVFNLAAVLILFAAVFDFFDGKVARFSKKSNDLGKQLDSLADVVSFGVAPAVIGYMLGIKSWYGIAALAFYLACGVLRLARFNITDSKLVKGFEGVPITAGGLIIAILVFFTGYFPIILNYMPIIYFVFGLLMISSIPIKKI
ncbi:MAG: CDP-diacylglycerol--serine O-phosphatidyltransferase [Candidatus Woesearchaeota archaeon]